MARGVNKVILVGNLGADPETRYTTSGSAVTNIRIATTDSWRDKQSGEQQERTEWHRVVFFGRLAEIAAEYLRKGRQVYIEGQIRTRKWQGQDGQDRYTTEIVASEMQMLGGRGGGYEETPAPTREPSAAPRRAEPQAAEPASTSAPESDFDDDIPFCGGQKGAGAGGPRPHTTQGGAGGETSVGRLRCSEGAVAARRLSRRSGAPARPCADGAGSGGEKIAMLYSGNARS